MLSIGVLADAVDEIRVIGIREDLNRVDVSVSRVDRLTVHCLIDHVHSGILVNAVGTSNRN